MTFDALLAQLDDVTPRGARWIARCPAHADKSPSLQVTQGERGILVRCWANCSLTEICAALGITPAELFFDSRAGDPRQRQAVARARERQRAQRARQQDADGFAIDALKAAELFIDSRRGISIDTWSNDRLDNEMSALVDAFAVLDCEGRHE